MVVLNTEYLILIAAWLIGIFSLFVFIPKNQIRQAWVLFLFKQALTWSLGHIVAEYELIRYPVRLLTHASRTSFTFEFFIYPVICIFFNLYYPHNKKLSRQAMHYIVYCSSIALVEVVLEIYTDVIEYVHWNWFVTWISLGITFYFSRQFYLWFFKQK